MPKVIYIEHNGIERNVDVDEDLNLMEAATMNMVPGIDGDCGGACACATCHVFVDEAWLAKLPPMEPLETSMLDLAAGVCPQSRLACQIKMKADLDGIVLRTPAGQH